jgi:hypothetical protein
VPQFYLSRYIGTGTTVDPFRPSAQDETWTAIDLRPDPTVTTGFCLVSTAAPLGALPAGTIDLGDGDTLPVSVRNQLGNRLGVTLSAAKLSDIARELLMDHAGGSRWKPLASRRVGDRYRWEIHLGGLLWARELPVIGGGAATVSDDFNRANSSTIGGSWVEDLADWSIFSNRVTNSGAGDSELRYASALDSDDQYAQLRANGADFRTTAVFCRHPASSTRTYYMAGVYGTASKELSKRVAGTFTSLASPVTTPTYTYPGTIRVEAAGSTVSGLWEGSQYSSVTDTSIASGPQTGIFIYNAGSAATADDFVAGDIGPFVGVQRQGAATLYENTASTAPVIPVPSGVTNGELLLAVGTVTRSSGGQVFNAPPAGWVEITQVKDTDASSVLTGMWYHVVTDANNEPANYTFTSTATSSRASGMMQRFSGVDLANVLDVAASTFAAASGSATDIPIPGITTVSDGAMLVSAGCYNAVTAFTSGQPTGMSMLNGTPGVGRSTAWAFEKFVTAGATGDRTWTKPSGTHQRVGILAALRPASPPSPSDPLLSPPYLAAPPPLQSLVRPFQFTPWQPPIALNVWSGADDTSGPTAVQLTDTSAAADGLEVAADVPLADVGTGTDALSAAATDSLPAETGAGADAVSVAATIPLPAETGAGTDAFSVAASIAQAETGTGTDAFSVSAAISQAETATGTDALSWVGIVTQAETGTGTDALAVAAAATLPAETGTGVDELTVSAATPLADVGAGADLLSATAAVPLTDVGSGSDQLSSTAAASLPDVGSGADALDWVGVVAQSETATGTDAVTVSVTAPLSDVASGADDLAAARLVELSDIGAGTDDLAAAAASALTDTGTVADELAVIVSVALPDDAAGTDAVSVAGTSNPQLPDDGLGADELAVSAAASLSDVGAGADQLAVTVPVALTDTATGVDNLTVVVTMALDQTAAGVEALTAAVTLAFGDQRPVNDQLAVTANPAVSDAAAGTDLFTVTVSAGLPDTGTGTDQLGPVTAAGSLTDAAAGTDVLAGAAAITLPETVTGSDLLAVQVSVPLPEQVVAQDLLSYLEGDTTQLLPEQANAQDLLTVDVLLAVDDYGAITDELAIVNVTAPPAAAPTWQIDGDPGYTPGGVRVADDLDYATKASVQLSDDPGRTAGATVELRT